MKFLLILLVLLFSCGFQGKSQRSTDVVTYHLNLKNPADDLFYVTVFVNNLTEENAIYNFAATAPGTYVNLNFGRLVKTFRALDENGKEIPTTNISTNQWKISRPKDVKTIEYSINDSFDSVEIMPMGGTDIGTDRSLINTFGVFGYFEGMQHVPIKLKLEKPPKWNVGTALEKRSDGYFIAENYDHFADSPILLGELTKASTIVGGVDVEIYVYSGTDQYNAEQILQASKDVLESAEKFIGFKAAPRYVFLMSYLDQETISKSTFEGWGALEHKMSSAYVLPERGMQMPRITEIMAHEFFHIVTPLNIHSEVIKTFNFATPEPAEHVWFYEGITEWASHMMLLRNNKNSLEQYLHKVSEKITLDEDRYNQSYSLQKIGLSSYTEEGGNQFQNIYYRGSVVAGLLDIRLLELSNGTRGLRELLYEVSQRYGKNKAFDADSFFDELVKLTYPEIRQFINDYIKDVKPLPYKEYYSKIGIDFHEVYPDKHRPKTIGFGVIPREGKAVVRGIGDQYSDIPVQDGDIIFSVEGKEVSLQNIRSVYQNLMNKDIGSTYSITVIRNDKKIKLTSTIKKGLKKNAFEPRSNMTDEQKTLRNIWMKNLTIN